MLRADKRCAIRLTANPAGEGGEHLGGLDSFKRTHEQDAGSRLRPPCERCDLFTAALHQHWPLREEERNIRADTSRNLHQLARLHLQVAEFQRATQCSRRIA